MCSAFTQLVQVPVYEQNSCSVGTEAPARSLWAAVAPECERQCGGWFSTDLLGRCGGGNHVSWSSYSFTVGKSVSGLVSAETVPGSAGEPPHPWMQALLVVTWDFFAAWRLVVGELWAFLALVLL